MFVSRDTSKIFWSQKDSSINEDWKNCSYSSSSRYHHPSHRRIPQLTRIERNNSLLTRVRIDGVRHRRIPQLTRIESSIPPRNIDHKPCISHRRIPQLTRIESGVMLSFKLMKSVLSSHRRIPQLTRIERKISANTLLVYQMVAEGFLN